MVNGRPDPQLRRECLTRACNAQSPLPPRACDPVRTRSLRSPITAWRAREVELKRSLHTTGCATDPPPAFLPSISRLCPWRAGTPPATIHTHMTHAGCNPATSKNDMEALRSCWSCSLPHSRAPRRRLYAHTGHPPVGRGTPARALCAGSKGGETRISNTRQPMIAQRPSVGRRRTA